MLSWIIYLLCAVASQELVSIQDGTYRLRLMNDSDSQIGLYVDKSLRFITLEEEETTHPIVDLLGLENFLKLKPYRTDLIWIVSQVNQDQKSFTLCQTGPYETKEWGAVATEQDPLQSMGSCIGLAHQTLVLNKKPLVFQAERNNYSGLALRIPTAGTYLSKDFTPNDRIPHFVWTLEPVGILELEEP